MKYYFFETSEQERDGQIKNTLRALPGQTMPDGTEINPALNVMAPKDNKVYNGGTRLEYPLGTIFCSTYITMTGTTKPYYSVYPDADLYNIPDFHPVASTPEFKYLSDLHKNDKMNAMYNLFMSGIDPVDAEETENGENTDKTQTASPAGENGMAKPFGEKWNESYEGQLDSELTLFIEWIRNLVCVIHGVKTSKRIMVSSIDGTFVKLYTCGENIDTLANTGRFEKFLQDEHISYSDLSQSSKGPHEMYLKYIYKEHENGTACSARKRSHLNETDVLETSYLTCKMHNSEFGGCETHTAKNTVEAVKKAMEKGWTLEKMILPKNLVKKQKYAEYVKALADGTIELPKECVVEENFIENLMADPIYARPSEKDGFSVPENIWKVFVRNMCRRQNTMIVGPTGSGKTEMVRKFCQQTNQPLTIIQMGGISDPKDDLGGMWTINEKGTEFILAEFAEAIQRPGVILLDEINRIPKNGSNMILGVLDDTKILKIENAKDKNQRTIHVHPECVFVATANISTNGEYSGTKEIDKALQTRFPIRLEMNYLDIETEKTILMKRTGIKEKDAKNIAIVAKNIRDTCRMESSRATISTRETLACAGLVKDGFSCLDAMEITFLPQFQDGDGPNDINSERAMIRLKITERFNSSFANNQR